MTLATHTASLTARLLEIQRMSTEDGPGIRTTIYFKGCSLKCRWCHNPESIAPHPQLHWIASRCIGCGTCLSNCPEGALERTVQGIVIDRQVCRNCSACAEACPATALERLGKKWRLEDLLGEVLKDRAYFDASDGGITLSGGEPGLQARFAAAFLERLREEGVHTALDTCGQYDPKVLEQLLPFTCMLLYDLKVIDPEQHQQFTGHSNQTILENAAHAARYLRSRSNGGQMWVRTPIIPGTTDTVENIAGIGRFIASRLEGMVSRWELCAFNNLCADKYRRLDMPWPYAECALPSASHMEHLADVARASGVAANIVHWSGAAGKEHG
ncbi:MAG: glycyl-radical enzyme activating protein [Desulfatitalea sp.]|nr:glycyl-radical enzyme activating protein [Desulfatitalea sp.]